MPATLSLLPQISTNVRFTAVRLLAPDLAGALAERLFLTPPRPREGALSGLDLLDARADAVQHRGRLIATWEWGDAAAPAVLLGHGWGGSAAQMRAFVYPLLRAGLRVVAFDQPAHGMSDGRLTGLTDFADVLCALARHVGGVQAVVAHSLGAGAAGLAIARGLRVEKAVLVSPPSDLVDYSRRFARWHWIPESVRRSMQAAIEERYGVSWDELEPARLAARLSARALIIHDRGDRIVPWQQGQTVARLWPGAQLLTTERLGHRRILRDEAVTQAAADFIAGAP